MDVAPVVLGSGKCYFGSIAAQHLLEDPDVAIQGNRVLHLRYRVAPLTDPSGYAKTLARALPAPRRRARRNASLDLIRLRRHVAGGPSPR